MLAVFLPITNSEYWFATIYVGMYCLMPFLNILAKAMSQRQFQGFLTVLGALFSIIPTFLHADGWLADGGAYGIVWFVFLYFIGAYIKMYYRDESHKKVWLLYIGVILLIPISKFVIMIAGSLQNYIGMDKIMHISEVFYSFNSVPALCASVLLFICFLQIKIRNAKGISIINFLSGTTFGIYLIHNNRNISHFLWGRVGIDYWLTERENVLIIILILCMVFVVCGLIESMRKLMFKMTCLDMAVSKLAVLMENCWKNAYRNFGKEKAEWECKK